MLIVNCFWAFAYSHLRAEAKPASRVQWSEVPEIGALADRARKTELTIVCRDPSHRAREELLSSLGFETVFVDDEWWVLR